MMKHIKSSFTGMAYSILKKHGKPMHYRKIANEILKQKSSNGKTPWFTLMAGLMRDTRFRRISRGVYGLTEWKK